MTGEKGNGVLLEGGGPDGCRVGDGVGGKICDGRGGAGV